jgi:hypothetical protein
MILMTVCEVCTTPKAWNNEEERYLSGSSHMICGHCKQINVVPNELKQEIKRKFGMVQKPLYKTVIDDIGK